MNKEYMAEKLKKLRKERGLTQVVVADAIGVSAGAYAQYELGNKVPRDDTKVAIAKFFGESVKSIFFNNDSYSE